VSPQTTVRSPSPSSYSVTPLARSSNLVEGASDDPSTVITELRMRIRSLELDREAQEEVVLALRQKLDQALREKSSEAAAQAADVEAKNEEARALEERIASLEGELQAYATALGTANAQAQQNKDAADALKAECTEHVAAAAKASAEIARLQGALHLAQAQMSQAQEAAKSKKEVHEEEEEEGKAPQGNSKLSLAAYKLAKQGDKADPDTLREVFEAAAQLLGAEVVASVVPKQEKETEKKADEKQVKEDEEDEEKKRAKSAEENELRRERDAAIARVEELRRETNKLKTDVLDAQEQLRTSEARVDRLQRQIAAKAVLSAANMQLEARVRSLTEAVTNLRHENHRLQVAHGVVPQPMVDDISVINSVF